MKYLFVGERPSRTAQERGWTWRDGRLAAKPLFEALISAGIDPHQQDFTNLFGDEPDAALRLTPGALGRAKGIAEAASAGLSVVAMGNRVSAALNVVGVPHKKIVHPAARGAIRGRSRYAEHIRETL